MKSIAVIACAAAVVLLVAVAPFATAGSNRGAPQKRSQCTKVRKQVTEYRQLAWRWQEKAGLHRTNAGHLWDNAGCHYVRWVAERWRARAWQAKRAYHHLPLAGDWRVASTVAQRVYPGTFAWLMSCSGAEGSHGRWVRYGGHPYYPGYEHTGAVGGWMQYRWGTFKGHYRHALDDVRARGFHVPHELRDPGDVRAWLSPLAQALAAGWARYTGNDDSHWSASWGNGC